MRFLEGYNEKEEGSSSDAHGGRPVRGKGKDKEKTEGNGPIKMSEDLFEYIMGMMELWTEKNVPMLHTVRKYNLCFDCYLRFAMLIHWTERMAMQNLQLIPLFPAMESIFRTTPPASFFPSFEQPRDLPNSTMMIKMASRIHSHWKSRKETRKGLSIIPRLNFDETKEDDPYLCFRRRDIKVVRKTRVKDTTPIARLEQVQGELTQATLLVKMVLQREKDKQRLLRVEREISDSRMGLLDVKRRFPTLPITAEEEGLLFTPRTMATPTAVAAAMANGGQPPMKKQRLSDGRGEKDRDRGEETARFAQPLPHPQAGSTAAARMGLRSRAVSPTLVDRVVPPEQLAGMFKERVDKEMKRKRESDRFQEDLTGVSTKSTWLEGL